MQKISLEKMKSILSGFEPCKIVLLIAIFIGLSLSNILQSGYYCDDIFNSCVKGLTMSSHKSIGELTWNEITAWAIQGRIFPFAYYLYFLFYWIQSLILYKFFLLVCTCLSVLFFGYFIQKWTQSSLLAIFAMLLMPAFFQIRIYHDPLVAFNGFMQVILIILLSSLLAFMRYCERPSGGMDFLSIFLFLIGLLTYDLFYVFLPLYFIVALKYNPDFFQALRKILPFFAIEFVLVIVVSILRQSIPEMYGGITINLNLAAILKAFCMQLVAAFPLSYFLGNPSELNFHLIFSQFFKQTDLLYIHILMLGSLYFLYQALLQKKENIAKQGTHLLWFGLLLWICPAAILSLAIKYQKGLRWGVGHIPVFIQYFGVACVFVYFGSKIMNLSSSLKRSLWTLSLFLPFYTIVIINMHCNQKVIEERNPILKYPRVIAEKALKAGILDHAKDNRVLSWNMYYTVWEHYKDNHKSFFTQHARQVIHSITFLDLKQQLVGKTGFLQYNPQNLYIFSYYGDAHMGFAKSGKVEMLYLHLDTNTISKAIVSNVKAYAWAQEPGFLNKITYHTASGISKETEFVYSKKRKHALVSLNEPEPIEFLSVGLTGGTLPYRKD